MIEHTLPIIHDAPPAAGALLMGGTQQRSGIDSVVHTKDGGIRMVIRGLEPDDQALSLILDSWSKGVSEDSPWARTTCKNSNQSCKSRPKLQSGGLHAPGGHPTPLPPHATRHHHLTLLKALIPHTDIRLLCDPEYPESIWGWVSSEEDCLHWIYVKGSLRGYGLGSLLMRETGLGGEEIFCSHRTYQLYECFSGIRWKWNPYRMIRWK